MSLLYVWLYFSTLKHEIQAVLSPKIYSSMRAMHDLELWKFQLFEGYPCLPFLYYHISWFEWRRYWHDCLDRVSRVIIPHCSEVYAVLSWLRNQILVTVQQNSSSAAVLVRECSGNMQLCPHSSAFWNAYLFCVNRRNK